MDQFKAMYLLEGVSQALGRLAKNENLALKIHGLLESLSSFDTITTLNLELPDKLDPLLCVANNIITRGTPTLPSILVEKTISRSFDLTERSVQYGTIQYNLKTDTSHKNLIDSIYDVLHIIDPRLINPREYINTGDLDSNFERSFLFNYIPQQRYYLCQLFEHQRKRGTIGNDTGNEGRIDFSLEIPYSRIDGRTNRFKQSVEVKNKKRYIVEIDGRKYHSDLLDDLKDFEIARLQNNIHHIREDSTYSDVEEMISAILKEDYISNIQKNFVQPIDDRKEILQFVLSPIAIARTQKIILQYLLANEKIKKKTNLNLLFIERDVPCGVLAVTDLNELLGNLNKISKQPTTLPNINVDIVSTKDFLDSPLHGQKKPKSIHNIDRKAYDLVLDIAMLRRTGIVGDDFEFQSGNTIVIRCAHFKHNSTANPVLSAPLISYIDFTKALSNEEHEVINDSSTVLEYFLQNIFRKVKFRDGQLPILNRALQNKPVIGLLPTGGGKSLTYQLSSLLQPSITVIVDPIRSLMLDQYNGLRKIGIDRCEFINSTQQAPERRFIQNKLLPKGELQFVFVSPERFVIKEFRDSLEEALKNKVYFGYCVIDEVHCVSEWGHDFRTPYLNLGTNAIEHCKTIDGNPVTLFGLTATASFDVLADIESELHIPNDDGNALVRYENTVRDEINYCIKEVQCVFDSEIRDQWDLRETIGKAKKDNLISILNTFKNDINFFNKEDVLRSILRTSYDEYLPTSDRKIPFDTLFPSIRSRLNINEGDFEYIQGTGNIADEYKFGSIVFCPHKNGYLGVQYYLGEIRNEFPHYEIGYFMGSSDEENAVKVDQDSFRNLERFVNNEQSTMVATKAFGMGIDKPNVRSTIHVNIPQSIESFVQEAGRAGRDQKLSLSYILFNNQYPLRSNPEFNVDEDVLLYFHKNSFKGKIKERQTLYELRTKISFPNTNKLHQINEIINELYSEMGNELQIKQWDGDYGSFLEIETFSNEKIGRINIGTKSINVINEIGNIELCNSILAEVKTQIPFDQLIDVKDVKNWLLTYMVDESHEIGIEKKLSELSDGETAIIKVPFTNKYYSIPKKPREEFRLNPNHLHFFLGTKVVKSVLRNNGETATISIKLADAIYNGYSYAEFIDSLNESGINTELLKDSQEAERAYYIPRSQEDTAKGIYRLTTIGIIDTYTIDYQNKIYTLNFTKHIDNHYFNKFEELLKRYTSTRQAERMIGNVKSEYEKGKDENKYTAISICLQYLTDFIYSRIEQKRKQAIDDMIGLCNEAISEKDIVQQSQLVKDRIYYYFNAKYSRMHNEAIIKGEEVLASMPNDKGVLSSEETIWKYLDIVENDETGEFKNNIKHLRGSTMRMLRNSPDEPHYMILKAYSLIILSDITPQLIEEARKEMVRGLVLWKNAQDTLNVVEFLTTIKHRINAHIEIKNIERIFNVIEDLYFSEYCLNWTKEFSTKFLKDY